MKSSSELNQLRQTWRQDSPRRKPKQNRKLYSQKIRTELFIYNVVKKKLKLKELNYWKKWNYENYNVEKYMSK